MKKRIILAFICLYSHTCYALDVATHQTINEYIAGSTLNGFSLSNYLNNNLGFTSGKEELVNGQKVSKWFRDGGKFEDKPDGTIPYLRSVNHFHNSLTDKGFSGLMGSGYLAGMSSTVWSSLPRASQFPGGYYSWNDVRDYYYKALTNFAKTERDSYYASTFRGLGQLMHLVQDMSVPSHTRDDGHAAYDYEGYVKGKPGLISSTTPIPFSGTINSIASFMDTNQYNGSNPSASISQGLSEYTNANFFSEDTIFDSNFPHPAKSDVVLYDEFLAHNDSIGYDVYRRYFFRKNIGGEEIKHLAYAGMLYKYYLTKATDWQKTLGLDNQCYKDYAQKLLPRAVGYSAGLLNYFFRGQINLVPDPESSAQYVIKNESTNESIHGTFTLYYDRDNTDLERVEVGSLTVSEANKILPGATSSEPLIFTAPTDAKEKGKYILVFEGVLGNENNAIVGKVVDLNPVWEDWGKGLTGEHPWNLNSNPSVAQYLSTSVIPDPDDPNNHILSCVSTDGVGYTAFLFVAFAPEWGVPIIENTPIDISETPILKFKARSLSRSAGLRIHASSELSWDKRNGYLELPIDANSEWKTYSYDLSQYFNNSRWLLEVAFTTVWAPYLGGGGINFQVDDIQFLPK